MKTTLTANESNATIAQGYIREYISHYKLEDNFKLDMIHIINEIISLCMVADSPPTEDQPILAVSFSIKRQKNLMLFDIEVPIDITPVINWENFSLSSGELHISNVKDGYYTLHVSFEQTESKNLLTKVEI